LNLSELSLEAAQKGALLLMICGLWKLAPRRHNYVATIFEY